MNTYLFKDNSHYKIGKSINVAERFKTLNSANPTLEVVTCINKNIESKLHRKYKKKQGYL